MKKEGKTSMSISIATKVAIGITYVLILIWIISIFINVSSWWCIPALISLLISVGFYYADIHHHARMLAYREYKRELAEYENTQDLEILKRIVAERELRNYMEK